MLAIVYEEEQLPVPQDLRQRAGERLGGTFGHPECFGNLLGYERPFGEWGQLHEPHPVQVLRDEAAGHLEGEARLARASRAGEGQEPRRGQASPDLGHLSLATHEAASRGGQVGVRGLACSAGAQEYPVRSSGPRGRSMAWRNCSGAGLLVPGYPSRIILASYSGFPSERNHSETWAGCSVSSITPARSLFRVSKSVSSRSLAENASAVFLASYLRL